MYLRSTWLWGRIRVQGGAYGGFCSFDRRSGTLSFLSYRDPNLLGTLANYDGACRFLRQAELSEQELTRSIIGAIGELDAYELPDLSRDCLEGRENRAVRSLPSCALVRQNHPWTSHPKEAPAGMGTDVQIPGGC